MATSGTPARLGVSVYLLKASKVAEARQQLDAASASVSPLVESVPEGLFIALPSEPAPPKWLNQVATLLPPNAAPQLESQSSGGILWVPRSGKTFVFTFGYGHSKVKDEWVDSEFGKTVALAVVPQVQVREVRAEQVFAKRHIANERAPKASAVREFGFEPDRDLVAAVEGVPELKYLPLLGAKVRGGVSFKFDLDITKLLDTLDQIIERFDSNDHRVQWPQANNLIPVRDDVKIDQLDTLLAGILAGPHPENAITLAAPTERSGDKPYPQHFVIGRMRVNAATSPYLMYASWQSYVLSKGKSVGLDAAKNTQIHLLGTRQTDSSSPARIKSSQQSDRQRSGFRHGMASTMKGRTTRRLPTRARISGFLTRNSSHSAVGYLVSSSATSCTCLPRRCISSSILPGRRV